MLTVLGGDWRFGTGNSGKKDMDLTRWRGEGGLDSKPVNKLGDFTERSWV